ncbi:MAG: response regulator, partial [Spirochaetota bacterium]|nr:response regulator [Spirochaetota bacterium]
MLHNPVRILLVDDDEDDFIITSELLSEIPDHRYDIHWSSDYQKAIQTLECKDFDICLFDYSLGAECGLDLLEDVINRGYDIPIILLTGQNNKEIDQKALEAGASDYLDKSELNSSLLERSIRYALERHNTLTELKHDQKIFK